MTTSLTELLAAMPACFGEVFAERLLGPAAAVADLDAALADQTRLRRILAGLEPAELALLHDLADLDGYCEWDAAARIYADQLEALRQQLARLGELGLVYQAGLSLHGALVLLPGLDELFAAAAAPAGLCWIETKPDELNQAVLLLNALRSLNLKCRAEGEPFKKGAQQLEQLLGEDMDVPAVYQELLELNCLSEEAGLIKVLPGSASDLAIAGSLRYRVWRFLRSCRPYNGLELRLARLLKAGPRPLEQVRRSLTLYLQQNFKNVAAGEPDRLLKVWGELGVVQFDRDARWIRLAPAVADGLLAGVFDQQAGLEQVIIKPDLEILVPRDFDALEHVHLGEVADLMRPDVMSLYRLSRASIQRAVLGGWTAASLQAFFERISQHQVPGNVVQSIQAWAAAPGRARILTGTFLFVDGERGELAGLELIWPGVYRLPDQATPKLKTQLERQGIRLESEVGAAGEISWGRSLSLKPGVRGARHRAVKDGIYPYGLVLPLPAGPRGVEIFENARLKHQTLMILYPKRGYGEVLVRRIRPAGIYASAGTHFVEAFCEDTAQIEVFELSKIKALLKAD